MSADIVTTLSEELAAKTLTIGLLEQALADERRAAQDANESAEVLRRALRASHAGRLADAKEIARLSNTLQTAVQGNGRPIVQSAQDPHKLPTPRTATDYIDRLATATGTAESTVRGNLTLSAAFYDLRHESETVDSLPLTQSSLWLLWLTETVSDHMGHYRTRYEQLLRRHCSLPEMLRA